MFKWLLKSNNRFGAGLALALFFLILGATASIADAWGGIGTGPIDGGGSGTAPQITSISPTSGINSSTTDVTISGTNFSNAVAVNIGTFDVQSYIIVDNNTINAVIQAGLEPDVYHISVSTTNETSASSANDEFTVISEDAPVVTSVVIDDYEGPEVTEYNHYGLGVISQYSTVPDGIKHGSQSRRIKYSFAGGSSWGGLMKGNLVRDYDLSNTDAVAFWIKGDGSGNTVRLDIIEATTIPAYGDRNDIIHEIWSSPLISLGNTEWQLIKIPYKSLILNTENGEPKGGDGIFNKNISAYQLIYTGKRTNLIPHYVDYLIATKLYPPAAPASFAGTAAGTTEIKWSWTDNSTNESGFYVNDGAEVVKTTAAAGSTEVVETGLEPNKPYTRNASAFNEDGPSASTESVTRYTLANIPVNVRKTASTVTSIKLAWEPGEGGSSKYSVYRAKDDKGTPKDWTRITEPIGKAEYEDKGLVPNTKYWYGVSAYNGDGIETGVAGRDIGKALEILTAPDTTPPVISDVTVDDKTVFDRDIIRSTPTIKATITDNVSVDASSITVEVGSAYTPATTPSVSFAPSNGLMTLVITDALPAGDIALKITVKDTPGGNSATFTRTLKVSDGSLYIEGSAFNYPNPFNPLAETTKLGFNISKDATVTIYLFDTTGKIILKRAYGATAGYNEFTWDGRDDYGDIASNGVYMARIVGEGKLIGRTKIWVIKK